MTAAKKKKINNKRKLEKGKEGELFAEKVIRKALDILHIRYRIYSNVYLQFPSSYGNYYGMTTEIDHIIITDQYIFTVEVKNQNYYKNPYTESSKNEYWHLNNFEHTALKNPVFQNYYHKMILSEKLNTDREAILQLEFLKDIPPDNDFFSDENYKQINSHVLMFDDDDLTDQLSLIFMSKNRGHGYDFEDILSRMEAIISSQYLYKNQHIENLDKADKILSYQFGTRIRLDLTDCVMCPRCGQIMKIYLNEAPRFPGKRRKHKYFPILRCPDREECNYKCDFAGKGIEIELERGFCKLHSKTIMNNADIEIKTIEERLGYCMPEEYQKTVYDEIEKLKQSLEFEKERAARNIQLIEEKSRRIEELQKINRELTECNKACEHRLNKFRHLIGNIYTREKKE